MVPFFISSYSFNAFTKTNSLLLIHKSVKTLEMKTSLLFNLGFGNNIILLCFLIFFLIIDLYFLIYAAIAQILTSILELVITKGIPTKEAKAEMETHPVVPEAKTSKYLI